MNRIPKIASSKIILKALEEGIINKDTYFKIDLLIEKYYGNKGDAK